MNESFEFMSKMREICWFRSISVSSPSNQSLSRKQSTLLFSVPLFLLCLLLLLQSNSAETEEWKVANIPMLKFPDQESSSSFIRIEALPSNSCVFDTMSIRWSINETSNHEFMDLDLIILPINEKIGVATSLGFVTEEKRDSSLLSCLINDLFCRPSTGEISLSVTENILTVKFTQATNQPTFSSKEEIEAMISITPPLQHDVKGEWKDPFVLELQLEKDDVDRIIQAYQNGQVTEVSVRNEELIKRIPKYGIRSYRSSEHGQFQAFVINAVTTDIVSNILDITVNLCPDQTFLPSTRAPVPSNQRVKTMFQMPGVFPISGARPITITNRAVPNIDSGSWSIAVWMKLLQEPTGSYRSIMFKGSPESGYSQRTPSVWLLPDSNQLTVRVSTPSNPDTEIITHSALVINQWTHLCFVFQNDSLIYSEEDEEERGSSSSSKETEDLLISTGSTPILPQKKRVDTSSSSSNYTVEVYINGKMDISAHYKQQVLSNNASLMLFKDVSFAGPKAFIQDLTIWNGVLPREEVKRLYSEGVHHQQPIDLVLELLEEARSPLLPYSSSFFKKQPEETKAVVLEGSDSITSSAKEMVSVSKPSLTSNPSIIALLTKQSQESIAACQSYFQRLDIHSESAEMGSMDSLFYWSQLLAMGFEISDSKCGFSSTQADIQWQQQHQDKSSSSSSSRRSESSSSSSKGALLSIQSISDPSLRDLSRSVFALLVTLEEGKKEALVPLAFALLHGLGLESLLYHDRLLDYDWDIPVELAEDFLDYQVTHRHFRTALGQKIRSIWRHCAKTLSDDWIAYSVLCQPSSRISNRTEGKAEVAVDELNQLALGFLYLAALHDQVDAFVALAYRYEHGIGGVVKDLEMAAQYSLYPADVASHAFHTVGAQPLIETDRIDDHTEPDLGKGNQGNDDEMIQYQKIRAAEGDVPAMLAMGDLYYFGARGLPRDQVQALQYFSQAAAVGDPQGMCGAAAMYLKGEGTAVNVSRAIELYERAAEKNASIRAYNGLGYLYFYGSQVPKNESKAFEYFQLAAQYENDGDSLFNAGFCLENGLGTEKNLAKAIHHYTTAAKRTGHFDSVKLLGIFHMEGKGVVRSTREALVYLNAAKAIGPWMGWIRRGLDLYLASKTPTTLFSVFTMRGQQQQLHPLVKSLWCYLYAGELGYEIAQSNAAYILRSKILLHASTSSAAVSQTEISLASDGESPSLAVDHWYSNHHLLDRLLFRQYLLSGKLHLNMENVYYLGNCYFHGRCGLLLPSSSTLPDNKVVATSVSPAALRKKAMYYYQIASYGQNPIASAYLGMMYHFNLHSSEVRESNERGEGSSTATNNFLRANRYYEEVLTLAKDDHWWKTHPQYHQLVSFVKVMHYLLRWRSYSALAPVHHLLDQFMKWFWV